MARGPQAVLWCLASGGMLRTCVSRKLDSVALCKALGSRFHWNQFILSLSPCHFTGGETASEK